MRHVYIYYNIMLFATYLDSTRLTLLSMHARTHSFSYVQTCIYTRVTMSIWWYKISICDKAVAAQSKSSGRGSVKARRKIFSKKHVYHFTMNMWLAWRTQPRVCRCYMRFIYIEFCVHGMAHIYIERYIYVSVQRTTYSRYMWTIFNRAKTVGDDEYVGLLDLLLCFAFSLLHTWMLMLG